MSAGVSTPPDDDWIASLADSAFDRIGGADAVQALAEKFYDEMEAHEPELAAVHRRDDDGRVSRDSRDRFGLFLVGWLGGPQHYVEQHGHPRLRMRHARVAVHSPARDAWLRSMTRAMDAQGIHGGLRRFLDTRFAEVADFLRNQPDEG